jgi:hypothetical protein
VLPVKGIGCSPSAAIPPLFDLGAADSRVVHLSRPRVRAPQEATLRLEDERGEIWAELATVIHPR